MAGTSPPTESCIYVRGRQNPIGQLKTASFNGGEIVTLTDKKFVYRDSRDGTAYTMIRGTKEEIAPCGGSQ